MNRSEISRLPCAPAAIANRFFSASFVILAVLIPAEHALATPLTFTVVNPSSSVQSRLDLVVTANLFGGAATTSAQFPSGGFINGAGSLSTLYQDTATTDSKLVTEVVPSAIHFPGGSTAVANNTRGGLGVFQLNPAIGGGVGTAPGDYGAKISSPVNQPIPPIDIGGGVMLNLGTLQSVDVNVVLRDIVLDLSTGGPIPLSPLATLPQTFSSNLLNVGITGTTDMNLSAVLKAPDLVAYFVNLVALQALATQLAPQGIILSVVGNGFQQQTISVGTGFTSPLPAQLFSNDDATLGTLEQIGVGSSAKYRLTTPIKFDVAAMIPAPLNTLITANFGLSGKLIGETSVVPIVPEPGAITLAGTGLVGLLAFGWRRWRRV